MRREHAIAALTLCAASSAHADMHALVGADTYAATSGDVDVIDVAWSMHVEWRELPDAEQRDPVREAVIDWVQREPLLVGTPRRELHELAYIDHSIARVAIKMGRFRVPGGFWLMTDGVGIARRWSDLQLGAFAGSRSFTNARVETLLTSTPHFLPLVGASLETRADDVQVRAAYTYTYDRLTFDRGDGVTFASQQPEQFVDAELIAQLGKRLLVTGGVNAGSRYLVAYPTNATDDPRVANIWFGSQAVYLFVDWRAGRWRLGTNVAALRTKVGQGIDATARSTGDTTALAAISGSFVESTLRATWRQRARHDELRIDGRYRARVFADGRQAHRAQLASEWRVHDLDVQASIGVDVHRNATEGYTNSRTMLCKASIGRKTQSGELALGGAAVAAIGDELSLAGDSREQHSPYTLEARSYGFLRAFVTRGEWFAGLDGEYDLIGDGRRLLVQIGYSR